MRKTKYPFTQSMHSNVKVTTGRACIASKLTIQLLEMVFIEPILNYSTWLKIEEKRELLPDQDPIYL